MECGLESVEKCLKFLNLGLFRVKAENTHKGHNGRNPMFTADQENKLANHCITLFYRLTLADLRRLAFDFAEANSMKHDFYTSSRMALKRLVLYMVSLIATHLFHYESPRQQIFPGCKG